MPTWTVPVPRELARSLERLLDSPSRASPGELELLLSRDNGFKIEIFADEHPPPHFHVKYGDEQNTFRISDAAPMHPHALSRHFRRIRQWHAANRAQLVEVWNTTRPAECPVGPFVE